MRLEVEFALPLADEARTRLLLAAAALPEVRRVVVAPDRRRCALYAADLAPARIAAVLAEAGIEGRIICALAPEAVAGLEPPSGERLRPIGR